MPAYVQIEHFVFNPVYIFHLIFNLQTIIGLLNVVLKHLFLNIGALQSTMKQ